MNNIHITLYCCEASVDGVDCLRLADRTYTVPSGEKRHLCDHHFRMLLRLIAGLHMTRTYTRPIDQAFWLNGEVA